MSNPHKDIIDSLKRGVAQNFERDREIHAIGLLFSNDEQRMRAVMFMQGKPTDHEIGEVKKLARQHDAYLYVFIAEAYIRAGTPGDSVEKVMAQQPEEAVVLHWETKDRVGMVSWAIDRSGKEPRLVGCEENTTTPKGGRDLGRCVGILYRGGPDAD